MKILLVITKADIGGAQVFVMNLAEMLAKNGYQVSVVAGSGDYLPAELKKRNIEFIYFDSLRRGYSVLSSILFISDLCKLLKKSKFDIVHLNSTNTLIGVLTSFFVKTSPKFVFTMHGLSFLDINYRMNFLFKFFTKLYFRLFLKFSDETVFVSEMNFKESISEGLIKSGCVIKNGLPENDMAFFSRQESRNFFSDRFNQDISDSLILGSVGRLAYQKNYEFLINNFHLIKEKFPNLKILIVGDGPYQQNFLKEIKLKHLDNDLLFSGAIQNSYKLIKAFDVYTLPSRYEGLSISLIEAIFAEIPILASDVGGNKEVVSGDHRQLFELNNIDDFLNKLGYLLKQKEKIVEHNAKLKEGFSLQKMSEKYQQLYQELISQKDE